MTKAMAMRGGVESRRISAAVLAATGATARNADSRRPDLLTTAVLAVLDVALDALRVPALVVGRRGEIVCSNALARVLIGDAPQVVCWWPAAATTAEHPGRTWEVTPISGGGLPDWSLVILRTLDAPPRRRWSLTSRQSEVLELVARGMTNTSIAETLGIRLGTVEFHISAIFDKVGVNNRAALIASVTGG
jgi:DNA-binding CsgD family transcriptional regulator